MHDRLDALHRAPQRVAVEHISNRALHSLRQRGLDRLGARQRAHPLPSRRQESDHPTPYEARRPSYQDHRVSPAQRRMYAQPTTAPPSLQLPPNPGPARYTARRPPYEYAPVADREIPAFAGMTECIFSAHPMVLPAPPRPSTHPHHVIHAPSSRHSREGGNLGAAPGCGDPPISASHLGQSARGCHGGRCYTRVQ